MKYKLYSQETPLFKSCHQCSQEKTAENFYKSLTYKDGLSHYCKNCSRDRTTKRNHRPEIKEKIRQQSIAWQKSNYAGIKIRKKQIIKNEPWRKVYYNITGKAREKLNLKCPCDIKMLEFKNYIELLFTTEMTWDNYGTIWGIYHIKNVHEFTEPKEDVALLINKHTNIKPMILHGKNKLS